jgi:hypothetical protein
MVDEEKFMVYQRTTDSILSRTQEGLLKELLDLKS